MIATFVHVTENVSLFDENVERNVHFDLFFALPDGDGIADVLQTLPVFPLSREGDRKSVV